MVTINGPGRVFMYNWITFSNTRDEFPKGMLKCRTCGTTIKYDSCVRGTAICCETSMPEYLEIYEKYGFVED